MPGGGPKRGRGALPNLVVIGTGRCGTTSLHHYLAQHPQIAMSRTKELRFFADVADLDARPLHDPLERAVVARSRGTWRRGLDWYRSQFDPRAPVRGESSPIYCHPWHRACVQRLAATLPDARLILCVRDPVERTLSAQRHRRAIGQDPRPADAALSPDGLYASLSRYADHLEAYLRHFPAERILVVDQADLASRPRATLGEVFAFLGVDRGFWSPGFARRWNVGARHHGLRWRAMTRLRALPGWPRIAELAPRSSLWSLERGLSATPSQRATAQEPSPAVRERLAAGLAPDADRLRRLTGRDFASWSV
jgi:hypothetical protein